MVASIEEMSDDRLLARYVSSADQSAFAALVERHGSLVWHVCRRALGDSAEAEDAFQATFIVLVRKAASIRRSTSIAGWLHQVAHRVALRARSQRGRGGTPVDPQLLETNAAPEPEPAADDRQRVLHDEIARLPDLLRLPVVLCYLEGLTNGQAALQIGCPEGTIVSRLARARERLRRRLLARGVVVGSVAAIAALIQKDASAAIPPGLIDAACACGAAAAAPALSPAITLEALRLADDVALLMARRQLLAWGAAFAGATMLFLGGWLAVAGLPGRAGHAAKMSPAADERSQILASLEGNWIGEELEFAPGVNDHDKQEFAQGLLWNISGDQLRFQHAGSNEARVTIVPFSGESPAAIDFSFAGDWPIAGGRLNGRYLLDGDRLRVCTARPGAARPGRVAAGQVPNGSQNPDTAGLGLVGYAVLRRFTPSAGVGPANLAEVKPVLDGTWQLTAWETAGQQLPIDPMGNEVAEFTDDRYLLVHSVAGAAREIRGRYRLDPARPGQFMDLIPDDEGEDRKFLCLYQIDGETLRIAMAAPGGARPDDFSTRPGDLRMSLVFRRQGPIRAAPD